MAAALALGICSGLDFSKVLEGPNLLRDVRKLEESLLPQDVRRECREGISEAERVRSGDWIAIWGGELSFDTVHVDLCSTAKKTLATDFELVRLFCHRSHRHTVSADGGSQSHQHRRSGQAWSPSLPKPFSR